LYFVSVCGKFSVGEHSFEIIVVPNKTNIEILSKIPNNCHKFVQKLNHVNKYQQWGYQKCELSRSGAGGLKFGKVYYCSLKHLIAVRS
jgi:hypothetical protein